MNEDKSKVMGALEVCKCGSNAFGTKRRTLVDVDCFKYRGSPVAADGRCKAQLYLLTGKPNNGSQGATN